MNHFELNSDFIKGTLDVNWKKIVPLMLALIVIIFFVVLPAIGSGFGGSSKLWINQIRTIDGKENDVGNISQILFFAPFNTRSFNLRLGIDAPVEGVLHSSPKFINLNKALKKDVYSLNVEPGKSLTFYLLGMIPPNMSIEYIDTSGKKNVMSEFSNGNSTVKFSDLRSGKHRLLLTDLHNIAFLDTLVHQVYEKSRLVVAVLAVFGFTLLIPFRKIFSKQHK